MLFKRGNDFFIAALKELYTKPT